MSRKFAALALGGAILLGSIGFTGTASAQSGLTPTQQNQLTQLLNRIIEQANRTCAAQPANPLCRFLPRVNQAEVTRLVNQVNAAVVRAGGTEAIAARLAPAKAKLCTNKDSVLNRVPVKYRTQASTAVNRLCAS